MTPAKTAVLIPDAKEQIVAFGVRNLATLTIEGLHDFIVSSVIPRLALKCHKDEEATVKKLQLAMLLLVELV